jgi:CAAX prenyl protease-like protein
VKRFPSVAYIAPFAVFVALLSLNRVLPLPDLVIQILQIAIPSAVILLFSRNVVDFRLRNIWASIAIGIAVFAIWIAPDLMFPGYRHSWLFQNALLGTMQKSLSESARASTTILALRTVRAALLVPIVEELFWRAWLMRWLISPNFEKVPMGAYQAASFWLCAVLFASEHGAYWDVGLAAGVIYNWWMVRTRSLGDLILTHAVTNACLSAYVIAAGKWEYWL